MSSFCCRLIFANSSDTVPECPAPARPFPRVIEFDAPGFANFGFFLSLFAARTGDGGGGVEFFEGDDFVVAAPDVVAEAAGPGVFFFAAQAAQMPC